MEAKKRSGTKFIKEVERPDEMVKLKCFDDGIFEIGQSYVKFHKIMEWKGKKK